MKFNELLSRDKFPLRAKTRVQYPGTNLEIKVNLFYTIPAKPLRQQDHAIQYILFINGKEVTTEIIADTNDAVCVYFLRGEEWVSSKNYLEAAHEHNERFHSTLSDFNIFLPDLKEHIFSEHCIWKQF